MEILASPNECCQVADPHDPGTGERRTVLGFSGLSTIRGSLCPPPSRQAYSRVGSRAESKSAKFPQAPRNKGKSDQVAGEKIGAPHFFR